MSEDSEPRCPLAVIVPVYRNADTLEELASRVHSTLSSQVPGYRLLFVVDASPDNSWAIVTRLAETIRHVSGLLLERNVGQHRALLAGLGHLRAEYYAIMDADLQDPPELLGELFARARRGNESVFAIRLGNYQSRGRMLTSRLFKWLLGCWTGLPARAGTYLVIPRAIACSMLLQDANHAHTVVLARHFSATWSFLPYRRETRRQGRSAYSAAARFSAAWLAVRCAWVCRMSSTPRRNDLE